MMEKLRADKKKSPTPTREEMINMAVKVAKKIAVNFAEVFKQLSMVWKITWYAISYLILLEVTWLNFERNHWNPVPLTQFRV